MNDAVRTWSLGSAVLVTGLFAGLFFTFSVGVMPGLHRSDPRTFIDAMQQINLAVVRNPFFMGAFLGAPVLATAAAATHLDPDHRQRLWWIVAAVALCVIVVIITGAVNIPLNDDLEAAGASDRLSDPTDALEDFYLPWVVSNAVRTLAATAAFGCLVRAALMGGPE